MKPNWEQIRQEWETTDITFKDLAEKHDVKLGTLKSRRSREKWTRGKVATVKKDATKNKKNATRKGATGKNKTTSSKSRKGMGNPNPKNQFTKRNQAARKHGLFAKYIHPEQQEIIDSMQEMSIADQIWTQIEIKFSAIVRLQKIMAVEHERDHLKEKSGYSVKGFEGDSTTYKVAYAHERYESYINAQSRAMSEYRNLVKQYLEITDEYDERRMKLESMQANIDKTKAETEQISKENTTTAPPEITIVDAWADADE